jgi:hypothetical protein
MINVELFNDHQRQAFNIQHKKYPLQGITRLRHSPDISLMKKILILATGMFLLSFSQASAQGSDRDTPTSTNDFESQLSTLMKGVEDNFSSLKGEKLKDNDYQATVKLDGSVSTKVQTGMLRNVYVWVEFGDFPNADEARKVYDRVVKQISNAKKPFSMVKQNEILTELGRNQGWIRFGGDCTMSLDLIKSLKIDKDFKLSDAWYVTLKIEK